MKDQECRDSMRILAGRVDLLQNMISSLATNHKKIVELAIAHEKKQVNEQVIQYTMIIEELERMRSTYFAPSTGKPQEYVHQGGLIYNAEGERVEGYGG